MATDGRAASRRTGVEMGGGADCMILVGAVHVE